MQGEYTIELVSILATLLGGFGGILYQIGRWRKETEHNALELARHEEECAVRSKTVADELRKGSGIMARLDERQQALKEDIQEIKEAVKQS